MKLLIVYQELLPSGLGSEMKPHICSDWSGQCEASVEVLIEILYNRTPLLLPNIHTCFIICVLLVRSSKIWWLKCYMH